MILDTEADFKIMRRFLWNKMLTGPMYDKIGAASFYWPKTIVFRHVTL